MMRALVAAALVAAAVSPSWGEAPAVPFKAHVDMKTFMEHVLTPAATAIWLVNGSMIDARGDQRAAQASAAAGVETMELSLRASA